MTITFIVSLVFCFFGGWFMMMGGVIENNMPRFLLGVGLFAVACLMMIPALVPM
jgi:hypothetical protein